MTAALSTALAPVRHALLAAARAEVARALESANNEAGQCVSEAVASAGRMRADARARGAEDAASFLADMRVRSGRQARALVLAARREEYEGLRSATRDAAAAIPDEPGYPAVRAHLVEQARAGLGVDAEIRDAASGGVIAISHGRRLDYSLRGFADRAVDDVAVGLDEP